MPSSDGAPEGLYARNIVIVEPIEHPRSTPEPTVNPSPESPGSAFYVLKALFCAALFLLPSFSVPPHTPDPGVGGLTGLRPLPPTPKKNHAFCERNVV